MSYREKIEDMEESKYELGSQEVNREEEEEKIILPECSICLEQIQINELDPLECGHMFHRHCISEYIKMKIKDKHESNKIGKHLNRSAKLTLSSLLILFLNYFFIQDFRLRLNYCIYSQNC